MRPTRTTTAEARSGRLRAALAVPIRSCSRRGLPCRRRCRRRGALLPHPFTLARGFPRGYGPGGARAVCFLWHCLRGRPRRALPGAVPPWSPDFPLRRSEAAARPSGALRFYPEAAPPVNMAGAAPAILIMAMDVAPLGAPVLPGGNPAILRRSRTYRRSIIMRDEITKTRSLCQSRERVCEKIARLSS